MKIVVNDILLTLQENDEVSVMRHPCEDCGGHAEFVVIRDNKISTNYSISLS